MSDRKNNKKSMFPYFLRYLQGRMSGKEKNSFEKELQKDPFAEEASEGFASVSPENATQDIANLQKRLKTRVSGKHGFKYYRIAASIAVLMIISTLFIVIDRNHSSTKTADKAVTPPEVLAIYENKPLKEPDKKDETIKIRKAADLKKKEKSTEEEIIVEKESIAQISKAMEITKTPVIGRIAENKLNAESKNVLEKVPAAKAARASTESNIKVRAKGKVLSSDDNMPVPGANVVIKGTGRGVVTDSEGNFEITIPDSDNRKLVANFIGMEPKEFDAKADSQLLVKLDPSTSSLSEVVVTGYGVQRSEYEKDEVSSGFEPPSPVTGKTDFNRYITENIRRPFNAEAGKRFVVVIGFIVKKDGLTDSIKIIRSPGKLFSDEAIRLLKEGPAWKPAMENGIAVEDEVRLRIIFQ